MQSADKFNKVYRRRYSGFAGVDFTNAPTDVALNRSPYAVNIYTDETGVIHKRKGWKRIYHNAANKRINGIFSYEPRVNNSTLGLYEYMHYIMVHEGGSLYLQEPVTPTDLNPNPLRIQVINGKLANKTSRGFQHGDKFYLFDQDDYWVVYYDDSLDTPGFTYKRVYEVATPAETQIAGYWYAEEYTDEDGETQFEYTWTFGEEGERNLLTARRINTFCGDGPATAPAVAHTTFYFDKPNFHVYKVELYSPSEGAAASEGTVTTKAGYSNIRNKPSMNGRIIGVAEGGKTFTVLGMAGSWYKIQFGDNADAYINQSRIATYTPASGGSLTPTASTDWEEIPSDHATYGWTVAEATSGDDAQNCTKITFNTAPPAHPRGHGLPNIRVTGAVTEVAVAEGVGQGQNDVVITITRDRMLTSFISVTVNGTTITEGAREDNGRYTHAINANGDVVFTVFGHGPAPAYTPYLYTGDRIVVNYRRESFADIDLVGTCWRFGRFGEYNFDRYFFTGNKQYPNRDWYSEPSDPTMVLQNSYTDIGNSTNAIAGYLNFQSEMLVIKYDGEGDCLFRRTATTDGDITIFPVKNYAGRGAVNEDCIINVKGECFYLSPEGLCEFVSSDMSTQHAVQNRDILVRRRLITNGAEACLAQYHDWLLVGYSGGEVFVADTKKRTAVETNGAYSFEWYYWTNMQIRCPLFAYDTLYFSRYSPTNLYYDNADLCMWPHNDGYIDYPNDVLADSMPIEAAWHTPFDQLDEPSYYKYIERRGMSVELARLWVENIVTQNFHMAIVVDGREIADERVTPILWDDGNTAYDLQRLKVGYNTEYSYFQGSQPFFTVDRRINRFRYIQLIFTNNDPTTEGFGILNIEFLYHYGRPVIKGGVGG